MELMPYIRRTMPRSLQRLSICALSLVSDSVREVKRIIDVMARHNTEIYKIKKAAADGNNEALSIEPDILGSLGTSYCHQRPMSHLRPG
jgi:hypothetical protein